MVNFSDQLEEATVKKMIGYKAMRFEKGRAVSGADSRQGFVVKKGHVIRMSGKGIFLSTNRKYVETYYAGHNPHEVLLTLEFDPKDITSGKDTLGDREPELTVSAARVVDFEVLEFEE